MTATHPQQPTFVPAGDTIEISLDWLPAPQRLPQHTHAEFMDIKHRWCRDMTERWAWRDDWRIGREVHVRGPADATFAQAMLRSVWSPAVFLPGGRTGSGFIGSRLLAFDLDDGTPYAGIRGTLASVGVTPFVAYHSPSSRPEHERFRVVLLLDSYVTHAGDYQALLGHCIRYLLDDHCDGGCTDPARIYFPGREIIEVNDPSGCILSVDDVLAAIEIRVREADPRNAARTMRMIRQGCGVAEAPDSGTPGTEGSMAPGPRQRHSATAAIETLAGAGPTTTTPVPGDVSVAVVSGSEESTPHNDSTISLRGGDSSVGGDFPESGGHPDPSDEESTPHNDSTISLRGGDSSVGGSSPSPPTPQPPTHPASRECPGPPAAGQGRATSAAARPLLLRGFPEVLLRNYALAHEFVAGLTTGEFAALPDHDLDVPGWLREPELFGLMTNACAIRGGQAWFLGTLTSLPHLYGHFPEGHWEVRMRTHRANAQHPQRCERFCPYAATCDHGDTIIDTIRRPSQFRVLGELRTVPLELARGILSRLVTELMADRAPGLVDVVHAQAGLGKTEAYIQEVARLGMPVIIAAPTHRLKDQIAQRLTRAGVACLTTPEVPGLPDGLDGELTALYQVGDLDGARRWILDHQSTVPGLREYVRELERALASDGTVITTHARLVQVLDRMGDSRPVIIDEDPLRCLRPCGSVPLSDLQRLRGHMDSVGAAGAAALAAFVDLLEGLPGWMIIDTPAGLLQRVDPAAHLMAAGIRSRAICLLGSEHVLVGGTGAARAAHYCCGRSLPPDRRIILFSATASEAIYSHAFGPGMRYHDVPLAAAVGAIVQSMGRTYSRTDIDRRGLPDLPEGYLFIGFRSMVDRFGEDAIGHFGAIEGLDDYGGRNIAVVGTPHMREETYHLLAHALGRTDRGMEALAYRTVEHDGMEFRFMTYRDDLLRTVQFHLIGSELEQAVGRARVLTEDCTVRVYSNFPLRGARHGG